MNPAGVTKREEQDDRVCSSLSLCMHKIKAVHPGKTHRLCHKVMVDCPIVSLLSVLLMTRHRLAEHALAMLLTVMELSVTTAFP